MTGSGGIGTPKVIIAAAIAFMMISAVPFLFADSNTSDSEYEFTLGDIYASGNVVNVASGGYHSLALMSDGTVWAWGSNGYGQLGDGTGAVTYNEKVNRPVKVRDAAGTGYLEDIVAIAAGDYHSLALDGDGNVWAWGYNADGQLGNNKSGMLELETLPIQVLKGAGPGTTYLGGVDKIAAGYDQSFAVISGTAYAWGANSGGQLGDGTYTKRTVPVQVSGLTGVTDVATGGNAHCAHTIALKSDGTVWAWGDNGYGQLGDGTTDSSATPVQVSGLTNITAIAAENAHSLALDISGNVWAWGDNYNGQLGNGGDFPSISNSNPTPTRVVGADGTGYLSDVKAIAAGGIYSDSYSVALKNDGTVWAWGGNGKCQLGNSNNTLYRINRPLQVLGPVYGSMLENVVLLAAGGDHVLTIRENGTAWGWGWNESGQLGNGGPLSADGVMRPVLVDPPVPIALTGTISVSNMSPKVGDTLTGSVGGTNNTGTMNYTWYAGGGVAGTGTTYVVKSADLGKVITFTAMSDIQTGSISCNTSAVAASESTGTTPSTTPGEGAPDDGISIVVIAVVAVAAVGAIGAAVWFFFFKP